MTVVNMQTGEVMDAMAPTDARRITTEAQNEFRSSREHFDRAWSLIEQAVTGGGHLALGYRSPGDYLHSEFDGVLSGLDVAERRIAVRTMTEWGLSTRAIAPVVGVSQKTVSRDTRAGESHDSPDSDVARDADASPQTPAPKEGEASARDTLSAPADAPADDPTEDVSTGAPEVEEVACDPVPEVGGADVRPDEPPAPAPASNVVGIDGKSYARPTPTPRPERSGEQQNAEENSCTLAAALIFLLAFQHPNQRDTARDQWEVGSSAVSPTSRGYVTPDRMRQAAEGLALLADEWENTHE